VLQKYARVAYVCHFRLMLIPIANGEVLLLIWGARSTFTNSSIWSSHFVLIFEFYFDFYFPSCWVFNPFLNVLGHVKTFFFLKINLLFHFTSIINIWLLQIPSSQQHDIPEPINPDKMSDSVKFSLWNEVSSHVKSNTCSLFL